MGEEDIGGWYEPSSLSDTKESEDSLFVEIGNTLKDASSSTLKTGWETIRTALADRFMRSNTGKGIAETYKYKTIGEYMPYILIAVFAVFLGGYFLRRAR